MRLEESRVDNLGTGHSGYNAITPAKSYMEDK